MVLAPALWADIYAWEWGDYYDHTKGQQPSALNCHGGEGLSPTPGMNAENRYIYGGS